MKQRHFVLVHGACHGAWCWYKVVNMLRSEGYRVTALDMAGAGVNPKCLEEISSFSEYCHPLMEFMEALPSDERVILVAHSAGGFCISFAMEKFSNKIDLAVFISAFMPGPGFTPQATLEEYGRQLDSYEDTVISFSNGEHKPPTSLILGPKFLASHLYQLSPPEDLTLATMLVRPMGTYNDEENFSKGDALTKENYGSVHRAYVICAEDNVLKKGLQEWMIENNPPDEVKIISDADHMIMFSKPQELCVCLQDFEEKRN